MATTIIGIDCSTDPRKVGIAKAVLDDKGTLGNWACKGNSESDDGIKKLLLQWIEASDFNCLLALDSPLGWPELLGSTLKDHKAGQSFDITANELFRRFTDDFINEKLQKRSLDVGADRIARTAHNALNLLRVLREATGKDIPLAWNRDNQSQLSVIEVYPAASLRSHKIRDNGYKRPEDSENRREIVRELQKITLITDEIANQCVDNADCLDSIVCVLAGRDFLKGLCYTPPEGKTERIEKEGWIWVRARQ